MMVSLSRPTILSNIALHCDQQTKFALMRCNRATYNAALPTLYSNVLLIALKPPLKTLKDIQPGVKLKYCASITLISTTSSLIKFFQRVNKIKFNYDHSFKLVNLIKSFNFYPISAGNLKYFTKLSFVDNVAYNLNYFKDYQVDCERCSCSFKPSFMMKNILLLVSELRDSCRRLSFPGFIYQKITLLIKQNNSNNNFFIPNSLGQLLDKNSRSIRLETCFRFLMAHLTHLTVSFSDIKLAAEVLTFCQPGCLKYLRLTHLTCTQNLTNGIISKNYNLKCEQVNGKFNDIDEFFQTPKIYAIFNNLKGLELELHNGLNRVLFKKFFFALYHFIILPNRSQRGSTNHMGKLKLKSFKISEAMSDYTHLQLPNFANIQHMKFLNKGEMRDASSIFVIPDLLYLAQNFTIFDLIDFTILESFEILTQCFFNELDRNKFEREYTLPFWSLIHQSLGVKNDLSSKLKLLVEHYDRVDNTNLKIEYTK